MRSRGVSIFIMERPLADTLPAVLLSLALCAGAGPASAQTLTGRVLEEGRGTPVEGVAVSLLDRNGKHRAGTISDSLGHFTLRPPGAGEYVIEGTRIGYEPTRSPLLALKDGESTAALDLLMDPSPIGIAGLEVTVDDRAEDLLQTLGHTPADLRNRWLSRATLAALPPTYGPSEAILANGVAGIEVGPSGGVVQGLCVSFRRAQTFAGGGRCAKIVLNGGPVDAIDAANLSLDEIESIAILTPMDATTFFGGDGGGGVVLIWTRNGRR